MFPGAKVDLRVKIERFLLDPMIVPLLESRRGSKAATAGKTDCAPVE
jgi:hypothetical protein